MFDSPPCTYAPDTSTVHCPICQRDLTWWRTTKLYKVPVCKKCRNAFANRRQAAWLIDFAVIGYVLMSAEEYLAPRKDTIVLVWVLTMLCLVLKDGFAGMSLGKVLCGVRVVDADTLQPIGLARSFVRNSILFAPTPVLLVFPAPSLAVLCFFGFCLVMCSQATYGLRWGDRLAGTKVVWRKHAHKPPFDMRGILCLNCGYDLTGNVSGVCPECGTAIKAGTRTGLDPHPRPDSSPRDV